MRSLMMTTFGDVRVSRSSNSRPATSGMPSVPKYPGATMVERGADALILGQRLVAEIPERRDEVVVVADGTDGRHASPTARPGPSRSSSSTPAVGLAGSRPSSCRPGADRRRTSARCRGRIRDPAPRGCPASAGRGRRRRGGPATARPARRPARDRAAGAAGRRRSDGCRGTARGDVARSAGISPNSRQVAAETAEHERDQPRSRARDRPATRSAAGDGDAKQRPAAPDRERQAQRAGARGEHQRLGQELADDPPPRRRRAPGASRFPAAARRSATAAASRRSGWRAAGRRPAASAAGAATVRSRREGR